MKRETIALLAAMLGGLACTGPAAADSLHVRRVDSDGNTRTVVRRGPTQRADVGAVHARSTRRQDDGSLTRQHGSAVRGPDGGTVRTHGSVTRAPDGSVTRQRDTHAVGPNGGTYTGSTSYTPQTGLTHTGSCTNAAGQTVACR